MELATVEKYYPKIKERFPDLRMKQIERIVKFGLRSYYTINLYGGDVLLKSPYFTMYTGKMFKSNLVFYQYWKIKYKIKLRIKYRRSKQEYDGFYYFGLTDELYNEYKSLLKPTGRRRQKFTFKKVYLYKILDECLLDRRFKHIFKVAYPTDIGFRFFKEELHTKDFEYILRRNKDNIIEPVQYEKISNKSIRGRTNDGSKSYHNSKKRTNRRPKCDTYYI